MRASLGVAVWVSGLILATAPALAQVDYLKASAQCLGFDDAVKPPEALTACKTALAAPDLAPEDRSDLYVGQGYYLALQGRFDESVASYGQALTADPDNDDARFGRSEVLIAQMKPQAALEDLNAVLTSNPDDDEALSMRGGVYLYLMSDPVKAVADYTKALNLRVSANDLVNLGTAWTDIGDYTKAIAALDEAIKMEPTYLEAFSERCYARVLAAGDRSAALADCDKAIALGAPADDGASFFRGVLLYQLGKYGEAWTAFDNVAKAVPDDPESVYGRGLAGLKLKRAGAAGDITAALKADADIPGYFEDYGIAEAVNLDGAG